MSDCDRNGDEVADPAELHCQLKRLYWDGAEREICSMILAYQEILQHHPGPIASEGDVRVLEGKNFKKIFDLWSPKIPWSNQSFTDPRIYDNAKRDAAAHFSVNLKHRRARSLLQSSGFLDINICNDYTDPFLPTHQQKCLVEILPDSPRCGQIYRVICCRACSWAIRSDLYYECQEGCTDQESIKYTSQRIVLNDKTENDAGLSSPSHFSKVRLCATCVTEVQRYAPCSRSHLKRITVPRRQGDKGVRKFQERLDRIDQKAIRDNDVQFLVDAIGEIFTEIVRFYPAGPTHCALGFGPLMLENGVASTSAGALITTRPIPPLCYRPATSLLYSADDVSLGSPMTAALVVFEKKKSQQRLLRKCRRPVESRRFLASTKQMYGGLFSGYRAGKREEEKAVVDLLVQVSESFTLEPFKAASLNNRRLHAAAGEVLKGLQVLIGHEVNSHLERIAARLLDRKTLLRWNARSNSCQDFTNSLLRGGFDGLYPQPHPNAIANKRSLTDEVCPWSSYLFAFKGKIDSPTHWSNNTQFRSIIWQFYDYSRNNLDLIEFTEREIERLGASKCTSWKILLQQSPPTSQSLADGDEAPKSDLVDALWELPRDTLSLLQTHLLRQREKYSSPQGYVLAKDEWILNRLRVLQQLDVFACLSGGLGSAWLAEFKQHPEDLRELIFPHSDMYGTMHSSDTIVTIQLGLVKVARIYGRQQDQAQQIRRSAVKDGWGRKIRDRLSSPNG